MGGFFHGVSLSPFLRLAPKEGNLWTKDVVNFTVEGMKNLEGLSEWREGVGQKPRILGGVMLRLPIIIRWVVAAADSRGVLTILFFIYDYAFYNSIHFI